VTKKIVEDQAKTVAGLLAHGSIGAYIIKLCMLLDKLISIDIRAIARPGVVFSGENTSISKRTLILDVSPQKPKVHIDKLVS
jgi:hypothetical protein